MKTKVLFFQPYIASWRADFLSRFIEESNTNIETIVWSGNFKSKKLKKVGNAKKIFFDFKNLYGPNFVFFYKNQPYPIYFSPTLLWNLIKSRPDIVITEGEINILNNIQIYVYKKIFKKKYFWWSLGKVRNRKVNIINRLSNNLIKVLLNNSDFILARNNFAKNYYIESGVPKEKIIIVPNSMNEKKVYKEISEAKDNFINLKEKYQSDKILLFVGALEKTKRIDDLIEVASELIAERRYDNLLVIIIGSGDEEKRLKTIITKRGLDENILMLGEIREGISNYFLESDLVVLPGMGGLVLHHAALHSKPIITRTADGTEEDLIINGYNGYILDDYSNENLKNSITKILDSKSLIKEMGDNSLKIIEGRWDMNKMIQNMRIAIDLSENQYEK